MSVDSKWTEATFLLKGSKSAKSMIEIKEFMLLGWVQKKIIHFFTYTMQTMNTIKE